MADPELLAIVRWCLETASFLGIVAVLLWLKHIWPDIPDRIPTGFGITGKPHRWGGRWHMLLMTALFLVAFVGLAVGGPTADLIAGRIDVNPVEGALYSYAKVALVAMIFHLFRTKVRVSKGQAARYNYLVPVALFAVLIPAVLLKGN